MLPSGPLLFVKRADTQKGPRKSMIEQRKIEHVNTALAHDVSVPQSASWQDVHFVHQALPEVDLDAIDTAVTFLGHTLKYPLFMSSLTGGHPDVTKINRNLALAAERYGLALGVGSQRAAIVDPRLADSYAITRASAPNAFLIANIGAPQLIPQLHHDAFTLQQVQQAIAMIDANALAVHMNSLQEATQSEGDRRAVGEVAALKKLTASIGVPVISKETGAGICREQALLLRSCGVSAIDVRGAGGSIYSTAIGASLHRSQSSKRRRPSYPLSLPVVCAVDSTPLARLRLARRWSASASPS